MKIFLTLLLSLFCHLSFAQERSYGMSAFTASEFRANTIILKVQESIAISDTQVVQLTTVTSNYWDNLKELKGHRKYEEKSVELLARRDKEILAILKDETLYTAYQKQFTAILSAQSMGYGRRR